MRTELAIGSLVALAALIAFHPMALSQETDAGQANFVANCADEYPSR
jgi:hypothetical protein